MTKRGRKRTGYFYEDQETAVVNYIKTDDDAERNKIFNEWLEPALTKMIECIIHRWKFYIPDEDLDETIQDTMSHLISKIKFYNPDKGTKAYSYLGTVCKRYLLHKVQKWQQKEYNKVSLEIAANTVVDNIAYSENPSIESDPYYFEKLFKGTIDGIDKILKKHENGQLKLKHEEVLVGKALIDILDNWQEIFQENGEDMGSNKFNKSAILLYLKDMTNLKTPAIRSAEKKFKELFIETKKSLE